MSAGRALHVDTGRWAGHHQVTEDRLVVRKKRCSRAQSRHSTKKLFLQKRTPVNAHDCQSIWKGFAP